MGLLDMLFGDGKKSARSLPHSQPDADVSFSGRFMRIRSNGFFGEFTSSPSQEWVLAWRDATSDGSRGGHRESGEGAYLLFNTLQKIVVLQGDIERPNEGHVANNGIFSIEDWRFGDELSSSFFVIGADGQMLVNKSLAANIINSGLSDNGQLAICQTAHASQGKDGNKLIGFDVTSGKQLFSVSPATEWATDYAFNESERRFGVIVNQIGTFWYDSEGFFLDNKNYLDARLACDSFDVLLFAAEELLKSPELNEHSAQAALEAAQRARLLGADNDPGWKALALKLQGIAYEFLKHDTNALVAFEEALVLNPKLGIKRKISALKKAIG